MKNKIIVIVTALLGVIITASSVYYVGNKPEKTYYPDGQIKSIAQMKFFKKTGDYTIFNQNGAISQKYTLIDGVKNNKAYVYTTGRPTEFTYNNGVLLGVVDIDKAKLSDTVEKLDVNIKPQNNIEIALKTKDAQVNMHGKILCNDEDFINKFQQFDLNLNPQTLKNFFNCLSFTKTEISAEKLNCSIEGEYQYPKFKTDTKLSCTELPLDMQAIGYNEQLKTDVLYDVNKEALKIKTTSTDSKYLAEISFKGVEKLIESVVEFISSEQDNAASGKLLSSIIENFTSSDSKFYIGDQKISTVEGDFNIVKGFSNPYVVSYYTNQEATTKIQITDKGISLKSRYPLSKKPMIAFEVNVNSVIKEKYTQVIKALTEELSKNINVPQAALFSIMAQWTDYAWQFSDVIKSVNAALWNNKGQKVAAIVVTIKNNINIETFFEDASKYVDIKIMTFENGKPKSLAKGNFAEGFTINGKTADIDDITKMLLNSEAEKTIAEIEEELKQVFGDVNMDISQGVTPVDPFLYGFYTGYTEAMKTHKQTKTLTQFSDLVYNVKTIYSKVKYYNGLNNKLAASTGIATDDIIKDVEKGIIKNAFDGNITVKSSKLFAEDEDDKAFVVEFEGLDQQTCVNLASNSIFHNPLAVAVGVQKTLANEESFGLVGTMVDGVHKNSKDLSVVTEDGIAFSVNQGITFSYAMAACSGEENNNAIAIKLF